MKYHRTYLSYVDTVAFCSAPLLVQAAVTWLWVAAARQENSGLFLGAKSWGDKQWTSQTNNQISRRHIELVVQYKLAAWEGDHLRVYGYDMEGQQFYQRNRDRLAGIRKDDASTRTDRGGTADATRSVQAPSDLIPSHITLSDAQVGEERAAQASPDQGVKNLKTCITKPIAAIRAAVAAGDALALLRANGCRVDGKEPEWLNAAAGLSIAMLGTILAWADGLRVTVIFPSQLTSARTTWRDLPRDRRIEIGRAHAETLGTSVLFEQESQ